ncbi:VWA domain-containing protein [Vampirovibrio sp.]|uniref:vWA domain-containing protein n=1 Tax=Vampirovibrio sp. TaxID=2717857 RepID=UPI003593C0B8
MQYSKSPGMTLIETSLLLVFASILVFMISSRSGVQKVGQVVKVSTEKLIRINGLLEQANTGELAGISSKYPLKPSKGGQAMSNSILALNSPISSDNGLTTTYTSSRIPLTINTNELNAQKMEYTWRIQDISQNKLTGRTPNGLRLYNATLNVYKSPKDNQPESFNTILQVNIRQKESDKIGMEILLDDSGSMLGTPEALVPEDEAPVTGLFTGNTLGSYADKFPVGKTPSSGWEDQYLGIPARNGGTIASTTNWDSYKKSTLFWANEKLRAQQDAAGIINDDNLSFPFLAYRYQSKSGYANSYHGLYGGPLLDPFDSKQLDITFDLPQNYKSRGQGDGIHTYPGPGVLKLTSSGTQGACDANPSAWGTTNASNRLSHFFSSAYVKGLVVGRPSNSTCKSPYNCPCNSLRHWLKEPDAPNKLPDKLFKFNGNLAFEKAHYHQITLADILAGGSTGPYSLYYKVLDVPICMYQPMTPPFHPVDYRENLRRVCARTLPPNPSSQNLKDFEKFKASYQVPIEGARNALIRFLLNLEDPANPAYSKLISDGEIGFIPFNSHQKILNPTPASKKLQTVTRRFEDLRMRILSINRYGAPGGPLNARNHYSTPTYETLQKAVNALNRKNSDGSPRYKAKIIVLLTDGEPTSTTAGKVLELASSLKKQKITLFVIAMTNAAPEDFNLNVRDSIKKWGTSSWGGDALFTSNDRELNDAFDKMNLLINRQIALNIISSYNYIDENLLN